MHLFESTRYHGALPNELCCDGCGEAIKEGAMYKCYFESLDDMWRYKHLAHNDRTGIAKFTYHIGCVPTDFKKCQENHSPYVCFNYNIPVIMTKSANKRHD